MDYCKFCKNLPEFNLHKAYHDDNYGFLLTDDNELFGRLVLEINQAGLSWNTILLKQNNFRIAFDNFSINKIAEYDTNKVISLLADSGIIRNKLKINSVIYNAQEVVRIQKEFGSFFYWLYISQENKLEDWVKIFKKKFKFVGFEIVKEFLQSVGVCGIPHDINCEIYESVKDYNESTLKFLAK